MFIKVMTILIIYYTLVKGQDGEKPPDEDESEDYFDYDDEWGPLYCTKIHKVTSDALKPGPYYKLVYRTAYIIPRQLQVFHLLRCIQPEAIEYIVKVCDWLEAPEVHISIHETHLVVLRKDNGVNKFLGYAVINITQRCPHSPNYAYYQPIPMRMFRQRAINLVLKPDDERSSPHRKKWHKEQSIRRTDV